MTDPVQLSLSIEQLFELQGKQLGVSDWFELDQSTINTFADVTQDWQFIHVNEDEARKTPFGGTIAHGFLTLSLLSAMAAQVMPAIDGQISSVNYGMNKLRFLSPVLSGSWVRGQFTLKNIVDKGQGHYQLTVDVVVEIENQTKPALIAEWLTLINI